MDDDPVLRSLGEELARDDPRLAALLEDGFPARPRRTAHLRLVLLLLSPVLITVALLVPPTVALGVTAMLLAVASPLVVCWLCGNGDRPLPGAR